MDFKISSIKIECTSGVVLVPFSDGITFFCGNTGVGKTTLLNLINYALGQNLVRTQIVDDNVRYVTVNALICGKRLSIERKIASNLITVVDETSRRSFHAKSENGKRDTFSDYLYDLAGIKPIEMLMGRSSKSVRISFSNFMWYAYLRQDELDNTLFYLDEKNGNPKQYASNYVLRTIFDQSELIKKDFKKRLNLIIEKQRNIKDKLSVMRDLSSYSKLLKINIGCEIAKKIQILGQLKYELAQQEMPRSISQLQQLVELAKSVGKYEAEILYLQEFRKIRRYQEKNEMLFSEYENERLFCLRQVDSISDRTFINNVSKLETYFKDCLLEVGFPNFYPKDSVIINLESFVPSVHSNTGEFRFDYRTLSSSGIRTIFKICYALAIQRFVREENSTTLLPSFMLIDTPMKNISERIDKSLYTKLYDYFYKSFSNGGTLEGVQLIMIDKELPKIFRDNGVSHKIYTRESPLIPCADQKG